MAPLVSVTVPTHNRPAELRTVLDRTLAQTHRPLEIIVVSDSTDETPSLFEDGPYDRDCITFRQFDERLGIARALNEATRLAEGDIVVTLDDDSYFEREDALEAVVDAFERDPDLGLLAFRTENYHSGNEEFPKQKTEPSTLERRVPLVEPMVDLPTGRRDDGPIETTYFAGCGYATRGEAWDDIGLHPPSFFYGAYEEDLAFRVLKTGYRIAYLPSVTVLHMRSPKGAIPDADRFRMMFENRVAIAVRHLPLRYVLLVVLLWSGRTVVRTRSPAALCIGLSNIAAAIPTHLDARDPLSRATMDRIDRLGGRLY